VIFVQVGPYPLNPGDLADFNYYGYSLAFGSLNGNPYVLVGAPYANGGTGAVYEWQRYSRTTNREFVFLLFPFKF
jgi:hypothetical protein